MIEIVSNFLNSVTYSIHSAVLFTLHCLTTDHQAQCSEEGSGRAKHPLPPRADQAAGGAGVEAAGAGRGRGRDGLCINSGKRKQQQQ